jgi:hypothetical protein
MSTDEGLAELVTFACSKEAYVYAPLPPATSYGHRAELWNPDKWLKVIKSGVWQQISADVKVCPHATPCAYCTLASMLAD